MSVTELPIPAGFVGARIVHVLGEWEEYEPRASKPSKAQRERRALRQETKSTFEQLKDIIQTFPVGHQFTIHDIPQFSIRRLGTYLPRLTDAGVIRHAGKKYNGRSRPFWIYERV